MHLMSFTSGSRAQSGLVQASVSALLLTLLTATAFAQNNPATSDADRKRRSTTGDDAGGRRGMNPEDMQARLLSGLRERLEVTDDEEWKLISDRITKVNELRRNAAPMGGALMAFAGRGGPPGGGDGNRGGDRGGDRGGRGGPRGGSTEMSALQSAVRDKLPDAEIKSRLDRVREVRKDNETKLSKAQEDLRALLTVRQEAVAVMFGLLP
jgi:hypothetical protein